MTSRPGFNCGNCGYVQIIPGFVDFAIKTD
jgi:hypothetical protein